MRLINKKECSLNTRLGTDHHQLIMPPINKDCSNTFFERSFNYAAPCEWNKLSEHIRTSNFDCFRKNNVYIIVIYDVITVDYCKCNVLFSPLNSYLLCTLDIGLQIHIIIITNIHCTLSIQGEKDDYINPVLHPKLMGVMDVVLVMVMVINRRTMRMWLRWEGYYIERSIPICMYPSIISPVTCSLFNRVWGW